MDTPTINDIIKLIEKFEEVAPMSTSIKSVADKAREELAALTARLAEAERLLADVLTVVYSENPHISWIQSDKIHAFVTAAAPVTDAPCICAEIFTAGVVNPDCPLHGSMTS